MFHQRDNEENDPKPPNKRGTAKDFCLPPEIERLGAIAHGLAAFARFPIAEETSHLSRILTELAVLDRLIGSEKVDPRIRRTLDLLILLKDIGATPLASAGELALKTIGSGVNSQELSAQLVRRPGTNVHKMCIEAGVSPYHVADLIEPGAESVHPESFLVRHIVSPVAEISDRRAAKSPSLETEKLFQSILGEVADSVVWRGGRFHLASTEAFEKLLSLTVYHSQIVLHHPLRLLARQVLSQGIVDLFEKGLLAESQILFATDHEVLAQFDLRKRSQILEGIDRHYEVLGLWNLKEPRDQKKILHAIQEWRQVDSSCAVPAELILFQHTVRQEEVTIPGSVLRGVPVRVSARSAISGLVGLAVERAMQQDKKDRIESGIKDISKATGVPCSLPFEQDGARRAA